MNITTIPRGFERIDFTDANGEACSLQQSSAIGNTTDAYDRPGSSMLWLGTDTPVPKILIQGQGWVPQVPDVPPEKLLISGRMHLSRAHVVDLVRHLAAWLETGSLQLDQMPVVKPPDGLHGA